MSPSGARRQRQLAELRDLCHRGAVNRAIDLAFEHFACFGQDDSVVVLLEDTVRGARLPEEIRRRLAELRDLRR